MTCRVLPAAVSALALLLASPALGATHALLAGVTRYDHLPEDKHLKAPANDVDRMRAALLGWGVEPGAMTVLGEGIAGARGRATHANLLRELEALPALVDTLEAEQAGIRTRLADGSLYATDPAGAAALAQRNAEIDDALLQALERWEVLGQ